jgi:hypothetical protein
MATLGTAALTLTDWAKTRDPDGKTARIIELLSQSNPILDDMLWIEGNLPTGTRTTVRTGLPSSTWRLFNQGVQVSKSTNAQIDEACGMLESWGEVDVALAKLNGDAASFRASENTAHMEAMNQEMAGTLVYGNSGTAPEEFSGFATRYSALGQNCISGGGSGSDNTSIFLVGWGAQTAHGIYPKGSQAGLQHFDHGEQTIETVNGIGGSRIRVFQDQWKWDCGLAVRDWRYVVRIANIDVSNLTAESSAANLIKLMIKAWHRIPNLNGAMTTNQGFVGIKPAWYMNRTAAQMLDIQRFNTMSGQGTGAQNLGGSIEWATIDGKWVPAFRGIPIRITDAILETEATVA